LRTDDESQLLHGERHDHHEKGERGSEEGQLIKDS